MKKIENEELNDKIKMISVPISPPLDVHKETNVVR